MKNPYDILKKEGIEKETLSDRSKKVLRIYDEQKDISDDNPTDSGLKSNLEEVGQMAYDHIQKEIEQISSKKKTTVKDEAKEEEKKVKDVATKKKIDINLKEFEECKVKMAEYRKKHPKKKAAKKTRVTKLKGKMEAIVGLIPDKNDKKMVSQTEKATLAYINQLKRIWGMDSIKGLADDIKKKVATYEKK